MEAEAWQSAKSVFHQKARILHGKDEQDSLQCRIVISTETPSTNRTKRAKKVVKNAEQQKYVIYYNNQAFKSPWGKCQTKY